MHKSSQNIWKRLETLENRHYSPIDTDADDFIKSLGVDMEKCKDKHGGYDVEIALRLAVDNSDWDESAD